MVDFILTHYGLATPYMTSGILANIGSCNGLLPDGTNPLPGPVLTWHKLGAQALIQGIS